jgi:glycosidase
MQWDDSANGGFTTGSPWMMSNPDYKKCNVASQLGDDKSVLAFWRRMIKLRKDNEVLVSLSFTLARVEHNPSSDTISSPFQTYGKFALMSSLHESVFAYTRTVHDADTGKHDRVLVILNFSPNTFVYGIPVDEHPELRLPNNLDDARLVIGTYDDVDVGSKMITGETVELRPFEGLMFRLDVE